MAEATKPTNEQIVKLLDRILSELAELRTSQKELASEVEEVTRTMAR